jgi:hypothetical protein
MPLLKARIDHFGRPIVVLYVLPPAYHMASLAEEDQPTPQPRRVSALVDTGASQTHVEKAVLDDFGLAPVGQTHVHTSTTGDAPILADTYAVLLFHGEAGGDENVMAWNLPVIAAEDLSRLGVQALLGRDVLARCLLVYDGCDGRVTIAFDGAKAPADLYPPRKVE